MTTRCFVLLTLVGIVAGSVSAQFAGSWLGHRLGGPALARTFAVAIVIVAVFIIAKTMLGL